MRGVIWTLLMGAVALSATMPTAAEPIPVGSGVNQAELTVEFGDGAVFAFATSFGEAPGETVTGLGLFDIVEAATDLTTIRSDFGWGVFIDGISYAGHSDSGYGGGDNWWHYWIRDPGGTWQPAAGGVAERIVADGAADGWVYGRDGAPAPEPSAGLFLLAAAGLCGARRRAHRSTRYPF